MPNTEAPHEELSLVVKKWKQEGTFIARLSTEASLEAFPLHSHCSRCSANHPHHVGVLLAGACLSRVLTVSSLS